MSSKKKGGKKSRRSRKAKPSPRSVKGEFVIRRGVKLDRLTRQPV